MSAEATRAALQDMLSGFAGGDHERLAGRYDDDIDWLFHAPIALFSFAGARRGKAAVFQGFAEFYAAFRLTDFKVHTLVVEDDRAAALSEVHVVQRATGRILQARIAGFYRFRDGKVIEYRGFTDSFDAAEQTLGHELRL